MPDPVLRIRSDDLFWREIEGEGVALDGQTWDYLTLNESGRILWEKLQQGASRDQLSELLIETYGISATDAGADVDRFLDELRQRNLLAQ